MPGLMSRAATIIKAKFSALLNRAENPNLIAGTNAPHGAAKISEAVDR